MIDMSQKQNILHSLNKSEKYIRCLSDRKTDSQTRRNTRHDCSLGDKFFLNITKVITIPAFVYRQISKDYLVWKFARNIIIGVLNLFQRKVHI